MRIGIVSPIVFQLPGAHADWEESAGGAELTAVAQAADRLGYHHLTCSEHIAVPESRAAERGSVYWDPLATLSFLAARTIRIRLATNVLVLGYHHPLAIAKRYGTLDALSGGRLILGVGVGTLEEEFAVLDARFDGRGEQADDALRALQASLGRPVPAYEGKHYRYAAMVVEPHAVQEHVPLWVGGRTGRSLRRAVTPADGWMPMALSPEQCAKMVADADAPPGFDLVLGPPRPLDPAGHPDRTQEMLARLAGAGATVVNAVFRHRTLSEYLEQMEALSELAGLEVGA